MMKTMKTALLASIAFAAVSSTANADDLADLKAMIQGLTRKDATSVAAVQVPAGYRITPTADQAPAADAGVAVDEPYTELKVGGYIKAGYIYSKIKDGTPLDRSKDFDAEGGVNIKGSVQSSLGEVGVTIQAKWDIAESTTNAASTALRDDGLIAFWQFVDTMKLEAGRTPGGNLENGIDKNTRRLWTVANRRVRPEKAGNGFYDRDMYPSFIGVAYASGPLSMNLRLQDATRGIGPGADDDALGVSAKGLFTSDMINLEVSGGYWGEDKARTLPIASQTGVKYLAGIGAELNFIPGLPVSVATQVGRLHSGAKMWNASASVGFTLGDSVTAGIGAGLKKIKGSPTAADNRTEKVVLGGIYYAPMSQLIVGIEGDWLDDGKPSATSNDGFTGAFVTRYSFESKAL